MAFCKWKQVCTYRTGNEKIMRTGKEAIGKEFF